MINNSVIPLEEMTNQFLHQILQEHKIIIDDFVDSQFDHVHPLDFVVNFQFLVSIYYFKEMTY